MSSEAMKKWWAQFSPEERKTRLLARVKTPHIFTAEETAASHRRSGSALKRLAPTEHPTLLDIAWAAGIYEGEGGCSRQGNGIAHVCIGQKDRWLCDRLKALFGGSVGQCHRRVTPVSYHRVDLVYHQWQLWGPRARGFLMTIFTWLSPRRRAQVRKALE